MDFEKNTWKPSHFSHPAKIEIISFPVHNNDNLKKGLQRKLKSIADLSNNE